MTWHARLQIEVHDVLRAFEKNLTGSCNRRVAAAVRAKPVASVVKRRLEVRTERLVHSLLHNAIDDIRDAKASLAAAALRPTLEEGHTRRTSQGW